MVSNFSFNDAYRVINNVIDERIRSLTKSGAGIEYTWGTVASIDSNTTCSVTLFGDAVPSGEFRLNNGLMPSVGDPVMVAIDKRGNRWLDSILSSSEATYNKLEIDVRNGEIRTGDGTSAPVPLENTPPVDSTLLMPTGAMIMYGGETAPSGWLKCNGASLLRSSFPDLFAVIGTSFGAADSTHFNLPDMTGRFPLGYGSGTAGTAIGDTGGSLSHTHTMGSHTHTSAAHSHSHSHTSAAHAHALSDNGWAQVNLSTSGATGFARLRRAAATTWSSFVGWSVGGTSIANASEPVGAALDGTTESTTPGSTGTTAQSTTPGPTGGPSTNTTSATVPAYNAVNFIIKT